MPLPAELEGKDLIGSTWVRRLGKHRGFRWVIAGFNDAGVKLQPEKQSYTRGQHSHIGDRKLQSIQWPMFLNLYEPEGKLNVLVTVDKEGFVQSVQKEKEKPVITSNGVMKAADVAATVEMRPCSGGWHRQKDGNPMMLPITEFGIVGKGPNTGRLGKTCISCRAKANESQRRIAEKKGRVKLANVGIAKIEPEVAEAAMAFPTAKVFHRWKVTFIPARPKPITVEVEAEDFLNAGIAAGEGEIIRVEKIES